MRQRFLLPGLFTVIICGLSSMVLTGCARAEKAPAWTLPDLQGKKISLADYKGKIVIINFWATYCPPCIQEIPDFIDIAKEYKDKGVVVIGLSVDSVQPSEVEAFVKKAGINYPVVMATEEVTDKYGAGDGIPVTVIVAPNGKIVGVEQGLTSKDYLETHIKKLLVK